MNTQHPLILGAVAYDPKVVTIWDGFQEYFAQHGLAFDYVLFTNYERQVKAHADGQIHVAWNSPLAWLEAERIAALTGQTAEAIAMRDTDRDLTSVVITRAGTGIEDVAGLRGRRVGVGAADSPQATLIPLQVIATQGLTPGTDFEVRYFDRLPGKHGDHIGGERDAVRALVNGEVDAACILDANQLQFIQEGTLAAGQTRVVLQTPAYDHCNFTVMGNAAHPEIPRFRELLLSMSYGDAAVRRLLDLEGLKQWLPGRTEGYRLLSDAAARGGYLEKLVTGILR